MVIKQSTIEDILMYMLGLFSTFQLVTIFGMTVFTYLTLACVIYFIVKYRTFILARMEILLFVISISMTELIIIARPVLENWVGRSIKNYILLMMTILIYCYVSKYMDRYLAPFLKGLYASCIIQLIWCFLQFGLYNILHISLNDLVFSGGIFASEAAVTQYKNGVMVINGLNYIAGFLAPVFLFGIIMSKSKIVKLLFMGVAFMTGSITPVFAIVCYVVVWFGLNILNKIFDGGQIKLNRINMTKKKVIVTMFVSVTVFFAAIYMYDRIVSSFNSIMDRLYGILNEEQIDASSFAHMRYYTSLPYLLRNIDIKHLLFGYGANCSGIPFIQFFNQYAEIMWIPESDFINYIFSFGLVGSILFYKILVKNVIKGFKKGNEYVALQVALLFAGFFYSIQLNWLVLVELLLDKINNDELRYRLNDNKKESAE